MELGAGDWILYFSYQEDWLTSVVVDTGAGGRVKREDFPHLTRLTCEFTPAPHGHPKQEDSDRFDDLDAAFEDLVAGLPSTRATYVGRFTRKGVRHYYHYSDRPIPSACYGQLERSCPGVPYRADSTRDPDWSIYRQQLHPGPALRPLQLSWACLRAREKDGDALRVARTVDHTIGFPTRERRAAFVASIAGRGWITKNLDDSEPPGLLVQIHQAIDPASADIHVVALVSLATPFQGTYEGWGAFHAKEG